jgi:putative NIF3 family GTP cyclohydrolase 1 type 2
VSGRPWGRRLLQVLRFAGLMRVGELRGDPHDLLQRLLITLEITDETLLQASDHGAERRLLVSSS